MDFGTVFRDRFAIVKRIGIAGLEMVRDAHPTWLHGLSPSTAHIKLGQKKMILAKIASQLTISSAQKTVVRSYVNSGLAFLLASGLLASNSAQAFVVDPSLLIGDEEVFLFREATELDSSASKRLEDLKTRLAVVGVEPVRVNLSALTAPSKTKGQPIAFNVENSKALHL
jgi:hypothetical protein